MKFYSKDSRTIKEFIHSTLGDHISKEEQLKLVKALVKCLSKERAEDYGKWFDVALCLHNINRNLLDEWKEFSRQAASYDPNVCDSNIFNLVHNLGGSFSAEHGIGLIKKKEFKKYTSKEEFIIKYNLKKLLDPNNIMNPGKIFN